MDKKSPLYGLADEIIKLSPIPAKFVPEALNCDAVHAVKEYSVFYNLEHNLLLRHCNDFR